MAEPGTFLVLGVGPGLGASLGRRFARAGHPVALASRGKDKAEAVAAEITAAGGTARTYAADGTREDDVAALVDAAEQDLGPLEIAVYNASGRAMGGILELEVDVFEDAWRKACLGGMILGREAARRMVPRQYGSIFFTGATASLRGGARFAGFAVGKFGLRALAQSMARELGPQGIHVAHFVIDGGIDNPRTRDRAPDRTTDDGLLDPDAIAETYYQTHVQHRSAWALEVDLRPWKEKF